MGLFSWRLSDSLTRSHQETKVQDNVPVIELVWESGNIGFSLVCFVITMLSIARFIAEALTPASMLIGNLISLVMSATILGLDITVHIQRADLQYSIIGLALDSVLLTSTLVLSVYSLVVYRRVSGHEDYHLPYNVNNYGYDNQEETSYASLMVAAQPYDPTEPMHTGGRARSSSAVSATSRRLSIGMRREPEPSVPLRPVQDAQRRGSYDHKRDTQFDEYRARRTSGGALTKEAVDHALGAEFGWGGEHKRENLVSAGSVGAMHQATRPRGDSNPSALQRHGSVQALVEAGSHAGAVSNGGNADATQRSRAHSLVCVPEHPEEDLGVARISRHTSYSTNHSYGPSRISEDREALLDPYTRPVSPMN